MSAVMLPAMSAALRAVMRCCYWRVAKWSAGRTAVSAVMSAVTLPVMLAALRAVTLAAMLPYGQCAGRVGSLWVSRHLPIQF